MTKTTTNDDTFPEVLYFGCGNHGDAGHYFWQSDTRSFDDHTAKTSLPWKTVDGTLCPYARKHGSTPRKQQIEGLAAVRHEDGWTALAFWDRSADRRFGSNSVFIAQGTHDFARMVELAKFYFPRTWERFRFEVIEARHSTNTESAQGDSGK
jgi:hypothetical protein